MSVDSGCLILTPKNNRLQREHVEEWLPHLDALLRSENPKVHFDLSAAEWFDVASLVFFLCILNHLKQGGVDVRLTLPQNSSRPDSWLDDPARKPRDFLKRWAFHEGLKEVYDDIESVLDPLQSDYFTADLKYYRPAKHDGRDLYSCRLIEIRPLVHEYLGRREVSQDTIDKFVEDLQTDIMAEAIKKKLGYPDPQHKEFASVIVKEAMINIQEHPRATLGFIGMAEEGRHLIVAVGDNGESISNTIQPAYDSDEDRLPIENNPDLFSKDHKRIAFAVKGGKTSKPALIRKNRGWGLTYVIEKTIGYGGFVRIRSGDVSILFSQETDKNGKADPVTRWPGNFLKIYLPQASS